MSGCSTLEDDLFLALGIAVSLYSTEQTSTGVDRKSFEWALLRPVMGTVTASVTFKLQESDSPSSGFEDIAGATTTLGPALSNTSSRMLRVRLAARKQYIRAVATPASGTQAFGCILDLWAPDNFRDQTLNYPAVVL